MSHLGRPDGKKVDKYSMKPIVPELEKLLGKKVEFARDCVGKEVEEMVNKASDGQIILLENLRFHAEEEGSSKDAEGKKIKADKAKVEEFRKGLTALGDIFISMETLTQCMRNAMANEWHKTMPLVPLTVPTAQWSALSSLRKLPDSS